MVYSKIILPPDRLRRGHHLTLMYMRFIFFLPFLLLTVAGRAQSSRLVYPAGDAQSATELVFNKQETLLLTQKQTYACVWDKETGRLVFSWPLAGWGSRVRFHPDGESLVSVFQDSLLRISLKTGRTELLLQDKSWVNPDARLSPGATLILTRNWNRDSIRLWSYSGKKKLLEIPGHIDNCVITGQDNVLLTVSHDSLFTWNLKEQRIVSAFSIKDIPGYAVLNEPGTQLLSFKDGILYQRALDPASPVREYREPSGGILSYDFTEKGDRLITCNRDSLVRIWDTKTGQLLQTFNTIYRHPSTCQLSPDGKLFLVYNKNGIQAYELPAGVLKDSIRLPGKEDNYPWNFTISRDNKYVIASMAKGLLIYQMNTRRTVIAQKYSAELTEAIVSPDNRYLLTSNEDSSTLSEIMTGKTVLKLSMGRANFESAFSPDGKLLMQWDGRDLDIRSLPDGKRIADIRNNRKGWIRYPPFLSGDGTRIGIIGWDVSIWEVTSGKIISRFDIPSGVHRESIRLSLDGRLVVLPASDSAFIFSADSAKKLFRMDRNAADSPFVHAIPGQDGKYLILMNAARSHATIFELVSGKRVSAGKGIVPPPARYEVKIPETLFRDKRMVQVRETGSGRYYYYMPLAGKDYLVFDADDRYDGTEAAIGLLYLACGERLITDKKLLEKIREPGLAEKIMRGEKLNAKKREDLDICNK